MSLPLPPSFSPKPTSLPSAPLLKVDLFLFLVLDGVCISVELVFVRVFAVVLGEWGEVEACLRFFALLLCPLAELL